MSNNPCMLSAIAISAKRLNITNIIKTTFRKGDNMVFGKRSFLVANSASLAEKNFQNIPFNFSMTALCSMFNSIPSRFQVGDVFLVPRTIITVIYLFRFRWFSHTSICRLFIKRHPSLTKQGITLLATEMPFLSNVMRWLGRELHTTIITHSKKVGTVRLSNFETSFQTYFMSILETLNTFWHIYIIAYFSIYENKELLND